MSKTKELPPHPYLFVKSIAEQGYSLSTAIADLIDNSITANAKKIELLFDLSTFPFRVYIADDGNGMSEAELDINMAFPSRDPEIKRDSDDLGRFGLGMKTASFSQTRKFTVLSRKNTSSYASRSWDVEHLKGGKWEILINSQQENDTILDEYTILSEELLENDSSFMPNTVILWEGLYKFESKNPDKLNEKKEALQNEIDEDLRDHLRLVFHRFIENPKFQLKIRINNTIISSFNPFPGLSDARWLQPIHKNHAGELITLKGFILPARAIKESRHGFSNWTIGKRNLTDMEGIYVYRKDRLIISGGWNRLVKKSPHFQLGRLMVDIGNNSDDLFQLNVSKSSIKTPFEIKQAFLRSIVSIKNEAVHEYRRGINRILKEKSSSKVDVIPLVNTKTTGSGEIFSLNPDFPLIDEVINKLDEHGKKIFKHLIKTINGFVNDLSNAENDSVFITTESELIQEEELEYLYQLWSSRNITLKDIKRKYYSIYHRQEEHQIIDQFLKNH